MSVFQSRIACAAFLFISAAARMARAENSNPPLKVQVGQEFGQLVRFKLIEKPEKRMEWVDRFGVSLSQDTPIGEDILVSAGIGGTYLMVMPENVSNGFTGSLYKRSYIGPTHGWLDYAFGGRERSRASLRLGLFHHRYNPEAVNLGEYLFRSLAYPTVVYTGGLSPTLAAGAMMQGARFSLRTGPLLHEAFLTTETTISPFYDFALSYLCEAKLGGVLTLGGGASWTSALSVAGDKTSPPTPENAYFRKGGKWYTGYGNYYGDSVTWYQNQAAKATLRGDTSGARRYTERSAANAAAITEVRGRLNLNDSLRAARAAGQPVSPTDTGLLDVRHYTFASVKLMARATFDPKPWIGTGIFGNEDLKIFAEAAILGVKDYPIFYDDITQRIPIMFGINLPAFKALDLVSFQAEYFPTRNPVSTFSIGTTAAPLPGSRIGNEKVPGDFYDLGIWEGDDWKWSLTASKRVAAGLAVHARAARDHFRTFSFNNSYAQGTDPGDVLVKPGHWYWMVNLVYGI